MTEFLSNTINEPFKSETVKNIKLPTIMYTVKVNLIRIFYNIISVHAICTNFLYQYLHTLLYLVNIHWQKTIDQEHIVEVLY